MESLAFWREQEARFRALPDPHKQLRANATFRDRHERAILEQIRTLRAAGGTLRAIAAELNRRGYTTRRGTAWKFANVAKALRMAPECLALSAAA